MEHGISGKIANAFIKSKLSILLVFAFLLLGIFSIYFIPREEDPQIEVPTADIMLGYPGASPQETESRVVQPMEKIVSNIKGVEHVYSTSMNGMGMLTVQFYVGQDPERSMVKLYNEIMKNMDHMPQGVTMPLIKSRSIDDVPVLAFTLWSNKMSGYELRQVSEVVGNEIKKIPNVAQVKITGGQNRQIRVILDKDKMAESHLDFETIAQALQANNAQAEEGNIVTGDQVYSVRTGNFFSDKDDVRNMIVGTDHNQPVYLYQVAKVTDGPENPRQYVSFSYGAADAKEKAKMPDDYSAVTVSIAKKKGADAMKLAEAAITKVKHLKENVITNDIHVNITRNYGATASQKVSELLLHLIIAIIAVTLFVMLAMGWRGGLVVFMSVPITFALTLFAYYFLGYTLNRITLFALVFVTGIVVDDSIVIAENMHRHFKMQNLPPLQAAIFAINEVGNPTILATLTVIAAVLPMAFVSGMMGPYMSPMPIGAAIAMTFSLLIALTLTPYFGYHFLRFKEKKQDNANKKDPTAELHETKIYKTYTRVIGPLLQSRKRRWAFMLSLTVILLATFMLFFTKSVPVKMLPFDNKNEFQVIIDMPEGTSLERTAAVAKELGTYISQNDKVTDYQTYTGTSSPINFNGLIRHYDLRSGDNVADIQVNLVDKKKRREQSHDIAKAMRPGLQAIGKKYHANVKVVEVPPGPPVMSTIVAEIYGPDDHQQRNVARQVKMLLSHTANVADVDWSVEADQTEYKFVVDKDKAMRLGIPESEILQEIRSALSGMTVGDLHRPSSIDPIGIVLQLPEKDRSNLTDLLNLKVINPQGLAVPIGDLVKVTKGLKDKSISRKDQKRVVYVTADVAGKLESPIYAMTAVSKKLSKIKLPEGYHLHEDYTGRPANEDNFTLKWDGEWKITYDVFRDLGIAFLFVLIIIYVLIVAWFQNFITPLVQLSAIPLSLIGIILGHWIMGAYFSAPSMIGFIALAGIMVRNSILLIDFIDLRLKKGVPLRQAIVESGAVRMTPILLTAGGVVIGAIVILFDPIFQGLAISLIGGTITSTILTLIVVPLLYFKMLKNKVK
ncbi:MAG: efflux RND transporter permease subunit [Prevotella sp.]|jgi:multidrug efflux pump subunit AcrB|nr:efflux RND transporter permease subunit [Prevotella sp.]MCI1685418.1 efflux RND transporter permease subunit [Prevotella sp.]MCI1780878.1 efflux RND transporter permease subunit [Prevotella sp.]MCI1802554.1 efflux RND transporter permease subunit [Prevotella sp.]MCI1815907.1 efflux RND transporter permease subunit [Prevotella sp.]MCI1848218.1 efflux RND transporter permease subunit [Prevotella sp.]